MQSAVLEIERSESTLIFLGKPNDVPGIVFSTLVIVYTCRSLKRRAK